MYSNFDIFSRSTNGGINALSQNDQTDFAIQNATKSFLDVLRASETASVQSMTQGGDSHALVEALTQSQMAIDTAVSVRNKVIEAYNEITRMPV